MLLVLLSVAVFSSLVSPESEETLHRVRTSPFRNEDSSVIDGSGLEHAITSDKANRRLGEWKGASSRVSVSTVVILTLAMAAATGLGAVPFFFVELDSQWSGICNGMAAGVMLAASFDLIQEGQDHGSGSWVVFGILAGGIFIWLCKKVRFVLLHNYAIRKFGLFFNSCEVFKFFIVKLLMPLVFLSAIIIW